MRLTLVKCIRWSKKPYQSITQLHVDGKVDNKKHNLSKNLQTSCRRWFKQEFLFSLQVASVAEIFRLQQDHELKAAENCYLPKK
jgi:hypothetical protein